MSRAECAAERGFRARQHPDRGDIVRRLIEVFLRAVDAAMPGLVKGFYLIDSVALEDYRPGQSDIDFIATTRARPDPAELVALRGVHTRLQRHHPQPYFDGCYVTRAELRRDPALAIGALDAHEGRITVGTGGLDPVTWHTLACHGVVLRGPDPTALGVWTDPDALAAWTRGNLESYWRRWRARSARWSSPHGLSARGNWAPVWGVPGVSRLHYTLATGAITSKTGAGRYALTAFAPRWHRLVRECLRLRRRGAGPSLYRTPLARRREVLDYITMVLDDAGARTRGE